MSFPGIVLWLSALPFAGIGIAFLLFPQQMGAFAGIDLTSATAFADVRAVYGGLQLGCAGFLAYCAADSQRHPAGLAAQLALYGGLFLARLYSYLASGLPDALGYALHGGEAMGLAFGAAAVVALRRRALAS